MLRYSVLCLNLKNKIVFRQNSFLLASEMIDNELIFYSANLINNKKKENHFNFLFLVNRKNYNISFMF